MSVSPLRNLSRGLLNPLGGEEPANVFRRDQRIDSFETILEPLAAPKEGDDPEPATFTAARGKEKAGDIDGAFLAWAGPTGIKILPRRCGPWLRSRRGAWPSAKIGWPRPSSGAFPPSCSPPTSPPPNACASLWPPNGKSRIWSSS
jgi:hypothetical protein